MDPYVKVVEKDKVSCNTSRLSSRFTPLNSFVFFNVKRAMKDVYIVMMVMFKLVKKIFS
jgi:hypothetical protein